ncbi:hypothetical protein TNCV_2958811 [Trichonephila clavipes]|nr:hypothetical protein TNCV_2958811 [Trichonephila clavipes]
MPAMIRYLDHWATVAPKAVLENEPDRTVTCMVLKATANDSYDIRRVDELVAIVSPVRVLMPLKTHHVNETDAS